MYTCIHSGTVSCGLYTVHHFGDIGVLYITEDYMHVDVSVEEEDI